MDLQPQINPTNIAATLFLALAVIHTFSVDYFRKKAHQYREGSVGENFFHFIGEVEVVFGLWAGVLICFMIALHGWNETLSFVDDINFSEPIFVFAIMTIASTKPIISIAQRLILRLTHLLPFYKSAGMYFLCLTIGPLLGSFITEPAAMTVTALVLLAQFYSRNLTDRFKYTTLAVLFVNISIGGVLTNYAAPPVLMVADTWDWSTGFMFSHFGWKAIVATMINASLATAYLFEELKSISFNLSESKTEHQPMWLVIVHLIFLTLIVLTSHHPASCMGFLLFFIGIAAITQEYQGELKIRESLLVAFFLAGLVVLGQFQSWWLSPLLHSMDALPLFLGTTGLTAITDNAALTYLGSQVSDVSEMFKYALVAGAVAGGGLTVIANAPNPAGYSILQGSFGDEGIKAGKLFVHALIPTVVAMICFWIF